MTRSWMWAAKRLGFELAMASPAACQPPADFLAALDAPNVSVTADPAVAVKDAHVINTDVWLSMGQEDQKDKELEFAGFEVNAGLLANAAPGHIVLHCLPAYRGKEISGRDPRTPRRHHLPAGRKPPPRAEGHSGGAVRFIVGQRRQGSRAVHFSFTGNAFRVAVKTTVE